MREVSRARARAGRRDSSPRTTRGRDALCTRHAVARSGLLGIRIRSTIAVIIATAFATAVQRVRSCSMLVIISPAKTLDMAPAPKGLACSQPGMAAQADALIADLRKMKTAGIKKMMGVSDAIAGLNAKRFKEFVLSGSLPADGAKQACLAFDGALPLSSERAEVLPGLARLGGAFGQWAGHIGCVACRSRIQRF